MQLRRQAEELKELDTQVLIISFGTVHAVRWWQRETGVTEFPILLDEDRKVYHAYGLRRSFWQVWSLRVMWHYWRMTRRGWKIRPIKGDPHQLGGDFVVDPEGVLRLVHASRDPTDRASVDSLLQVVAQIKRGAA